MTDEEKQAADAAFILESTVFKEAMAALDASYVRGWRGAQDPAARDAFWVKQKVLRDVQAEIKNFLTAVAMKEKTRGPFRERLGRIKG